MSLKNDVQAAFAICAAIIGAGFASGREIVSFFSGLGGVSYIGVIAASAALGGLVYVILRLCVHTKASSFPELYGALMGNGCRDAMHILYLLLCLTASAAMLSAGARLGALTFDCQNSPLIGLMLTLSCSAIAVCMGIKSLSVLGTILTPAIAVYYLAMALRGRYSVEFSLDMLPVSLPMGLLYAAFNTALSGGAICLTAHKDVSPKRTGLLTGGMMLILLLCANEAMLRAGDAFRRAALPSVVLAIQWGIAGYYISIFIMWFSILTTLCALFHAMRAQLISFRLSPAAALLLPAIGAALLSICGFDALVDIGYPLLGWVCCCALIALLLFLPEEKPCFTPPTDTVSR